MKVNLPVYLISRDIFSIENFLLLVCFIVPLALLGYWLFNLSQEDEFDEVRLPLNLNWSPQKNKKKKDSNVEEGGIERSAYGEALKILDRARADSLKILGRAQMKAQGLLDNTYVISKENRKKLEDSVKSIYEKQERVLDNLSEELLENYRLAIEQGKKENIRTLYEVTEAMKKEAIQGVDELKDVVKRETMGAQDALEEKITSEYAKVDLEIKDYKKKKVEGLNKKIFELLSNIHSEVIGQELDQIKHEKLILELLDREIKKSGLKMN
jgi:hypothetical protein